VKPACTKRVISIASNGSRMLCDAINQFLDEPERFESAGTWRLVTITLDERREIYTAFLERVA